MTVKNYVDASLSSLRVVLERCTADRSKYQIDICGVLEQIWRATQATRGSFRFIAGLQSAASSQVNSPYGILVIRGRGVGSNRQLPVHRGGFALLAAAMRSPARR